jgi:hypothetical protein
MTSKKLYGKELKEFDDIDVDDLLTQLSAEELEILSKEVDPDVRINEFYLFIFCLLTSNAVSFSWKPIKI